MYMLTRAHFVYSLYLIDCGVFANKHRIGVYVLIPLSVERTRTRACWRLLVVLLLLLGWDDGILIIWSPSAPKASTDNVSALMQQQQQQQPEPKPEPQNPVANTMETQNEEDGTVPARCGGMRCDAQRCWRCWRCWRCDDDATYLHCRPSSLRRRRRRRGGCHCWCRYNVARECVGWPHLIVLEKRDTDIILSYISLEWMGCGWQCDFDATRPAIRNDAMSVSHVRFCTFYVSVPNAQD